MEKCGITKFLARKWKILITFASKIMVLHVFNPEHDLALASGLSNFTAPHAGRQLHADLAWMPALWAAPGDAVLVDSVDEARRDFARLMHCPFSGFVVKSQLSRLAITRVEPWGWDAALKAFLMRWGVPPEACPSDAEIADIRRLSHRRTAVDLLPKLRLPSTVGESAMADSLQAVSLLLTRWGRVVVKSPWSSSGRGIRFLCGSPDAYQTGWLSNVIRRQGAVVVEPHYNNVKDFAVEFERLNSGEVVCRGLSLFHTANGAYTGNILADEYEKREMISRYVPESLLTSVQQSICQLLTASLGSYRGPFGVDMMVVARPDADGFMLHPCVELNLRRTMGHAALAIQRQGVMQVEYTDNHYKLKIRPL